MRVPSCSGTSITVFCANCGTATIVKGGGTRRQCPGCHKEHFPRVDPVVIMLATNGDECLLGRQSSWPEGMWSALAGFTEPGETLEEACARELNEEAGVTADIPAIRYVMGQPWPFPSSLMIGLVAPVSDATITVDTHELESARWFHRDEVAAMLAGTHPGGRHAAFHRHCPPPGGIVGGRTDLTRPAPGPFRRLSARATGSAWTRPWTGKPHPAVSPQYG